MKIAIDFNETIQAQHNEIIKSVNCEFGLRLSFSDFDIWNAPIAKRYGIKNEAELNSFMWCNTDLQMIAKPFHNAQPVIYAMHKAGHHIDILTSTCLDNDQLAYYLREHKIPYHTITNASSADKHAHDFDLLIDDSPVVIEGMIKACRADQIIIKSQLYNEKYSLRRFTNWDEFAV